MKKAFWKRAVFTLLALALPAASACADYEEDPFYASHQTECRYSGDEYEAASAAAVYTGPESDENVGTLDAGDVILIEQLWRSWGYAAGYDGWVDLSLFRRLYNEDDFYEEHAGELEERSGLPAVVDGSPVVFWRFPGSGVCAGSALIEKAQDAPSYHRIYIDENGDEWALVGYYHGLHGWVYLSDPSQGELPAAAPRYAEEPEAESLLTLPERPAYFVVSCLIVAASIAASFLLYAKRKRLTP